MKITIKYFASLREQAKVNQEVVDVNETITLLELFSTISQKYKFSYELYDIKFAVNNTYVQNNYVLKPNDELVFIPPVAGG